MKIEQKLNRFPFFATETTYLKKLKQTLKIVERFADRRSRDAPTIDGLQPQGHLGSFRRRVLNHLGFVEADAPPIEN